MTEVPLGGDTVNGARVFVRVRREAAPPRSDLSIPRQELLWAANRDLCVAAKGQQIPVSRDDDVSPAFHRALEHAIVLGVRGDDRQPGLGLDDLGDLPELRVDLIGGGLGLAELRSGEDATQLVEDGRGEDEAVRARQDSLEDVARRALEDDGRDEDVRVEDKPHVPPAISAACAPGGRRPRPPPRRPPSGPAASPGAGQI